MQCLQPDWREVLPSTNTWLLKRLDAGEDLPSGYVLATRRQTAGRGRRGRGWISTAGDDLTFSLVVRSRVQPLQLMSLPMAAALGVAECLEQCYRLRPRTRWPNDLLVGSRKICGILTERRKDSLVVGIGLNVNMTPDTAAAIDRPATSLAMETGRQHTVETVLPPILCGLNHWITAWEGGAFAALRPAWTQRCAYLGTPVTVWDGHAPVTGLLAGFGAWGEAKLAQPDGSLREIWAGDLVPH